jgi:uncharacterized membrane protein
MSEVRGLSRVQNFALVAAAVFYIATGALHFIAPGPYLKIVPPYLLPHAAGVVGVSGLLEILGGIGLLVTRTRRVAAWGLVALLIAVFPANIYMAVSPSDTGVGSISPVLLWGRLPLQGILIWWVLWCTEPRFGDGSHH